jgi:hypothetical protein
MDRTEQADHIETMSHPFSWRFLVIAAVAGLLLLAAMVTTVSMRGGESSALIVSDGKAYYAWARSVWIDGDVDFDNDYRLLYPPDPLPPDLGRLTDSGKVLNKTPIGLAVLETPGVWLGSLAARLTGYPEDGVSAPYQLVVCGLLILFYAFGWMLLYFAWLRLGVPPDRAFVFWLGVVGASNLVHYVTKEPSMTHAASMAAASLLLYIVSGWQSNKEWALLQGIPAGVVLGLLLVIRTANLAILPFLVALLIARRLVSGRLIAGVIVGALLPVILQSGATYALWGKFGYGLYPDETFSSEWSGVWLGLFSHRHGLFSHHPWYLLLLALNVLVIIRAPRQRLVAAGALITWGIIALGNGLWWCWWFRDSFGNRAFIETLIPLSTVAALGLPAWQRSRMLRAGLVAALTLCIMANLYLWAGYMLGRYAHNGDDSLRQVYGWAIGE